MTQPTNNTISAGLVIGVGILINLAYSMGRRGDDPQGNTLGTGLPDLICLLATVADTALAEGLDGEQVKARCIEELTKHGLVIAAHKPDTNH